MSNANSQPYTWTMCPDKTLQVNSVSVSDDGTRCVFGTSNEFSEGKFATYCCDGQGNLLWQQPVATESTYQGIFWVAVSGNGQFVASGGEHTKTDGFLKAYAADNGAPLLDVALDSRVNQVSFSEDGQWLVACYASTLEVYQLKSDGSAYVLNSRESLAPYGLNSCEISRNGSRIVASGIQYIDGGESTTTKGKVFSFAISGDTVAYMGGCDLYTGCMRVAVVDSGHFWAASLHDGSCLLFHSDKPYQWQWQYTPEDVSLSLAYAVDVTQTDGGDVFVACGANVHAADHDGLLYMVKSVYRRDGYQGELQWTADIKRSVNPGVSLDHNAQYVTATDGQPLEHSSKESPGSFYLFSGASGIKQWQYDTPLMNWPMMLAHDGNSVFGGSDDGSVYYWQLS